MVNESQRVYLKALSRKIKEDAFPPLIRKHFDIMNSHRNKLFYTDCKIYYRCSSRLYKKEFPQISPLICISGIKVSLDNFFKRFTIAGVLWLHFCYNTTHTIILGSLSLSFGSLSLARPVLERTCHSLQYKYKNSEGH